MINIRNCVLASLPCMAFNSSKRFLHKCDHISHLLFLQKQLTQSEHALRVVCFSSRTDFERGPENVNNRIFVGALKVDTGNISFQPKMGIF